MSGKITLITPPDFYENYSQSVLFINLKDTDQDAVSKWLAYKDVERDLNFYVYSGETDIPWLLWASSRCEHKIINLDTDSQIIKHVSGYLLGKPNFYYTTDNENTAAIFSHINNCRVQDITKFLEKIISDQEPKS